MEEQSVSFETAVLANKKGFLILSTAEYENNLKTIKNFKFDKLPKQGSVQKWLREVHNIEVLISRIPPEAVLADKNKGKNILKNYNCYIWNLNSNPRIANNGTFLDIYEEALEIGLQEALKLIK